MGYQYNDAEMMLATQIAYLDISGEDVSVGDVVDNILEYGHCVNGEWVLYEQYQNDPQSKYWKKQLEVAGNISELTKRYDNLGDDWRNWKVVDRCDDQNGTGYYGCLIDTGNDHAIIGCRGSESYNKEQVVKDWIVADVGLLDSELTTQQERAQRYMEELYYKYGDQYDTFSLTGHSLGGNLAQHMTIHAPAEMRDKIDHCISFDGPGFSQEYIDKNRHLIDQTDDCMDHYQWSWVSSLLIPLPGVNPKIIAAHDDERYGFPKAVLYRHDVRNVDLDENGNVQRGKESGLSELLGPISRYLERLGEGTLIDYVSKGLLPKFTGFVILYKLVRDAVIAFYKVSESIKEKIASIYYDYIAPNVSGEYEIQLDTVGSYEAELKKAQKKLDAVTDEIRTISRTWNNWSASGAYYRSQLNIIKNGLELDVRVLSSLAKTTENIVNAYIAADNNVANLFS